jgi:hypothetical protein
MLSQEMLAVNSSQTLKFFTERLLWITDKQVTNEQELKYNASILAHFASRESDTIEITSLDGVFDLYVMDRSQHADAEISETAAVHCLLFVGFFRNQVNKRRHNINWYEELGSAFFARAAEFHRDKRRARMSHRMSRHFTFWCHVHASLNRSFAEEPYLIPQSRLN